MLHTSQEVRPVAPVPCRNLKRFMHYCGRWEAHEASHLLEEKLQAATQARIARLEDTELELKDWSWLLAVRQRGCPPCRCTLALIWG